MNIRSATLPTSSAGDPEKLRFVPQAYKKVAGDLESQFNEFMLEQMGRTVDRADEESTAEAYYQGLLNSERAKAMAATDKGIGLKKIILDQIYPERLRNETSFQIQERSLAKNKAPVASTKVKIYAQGGQHEQH